MTTLLTTGATNTSPTKSAETAPASSEHTYTLHPDERISHMLHIDEAELARLRSILKEQITFMWGSRNVNPFVRPILKQIIRLALAARDAWDITADISDCPRYRLRQPRTIQS